MFWSAFSLKANLRDLFRPPPSRFAALDGLRAIAVLWVFTWHLLYMSSDYVKPDQFIAVMKLPIIRFVTHGHITMTIFFVVSGFLIGGQLISELDKQQTIDRKRFHWRRFLRLAPVYFALMAVIIAGKVLTNTVDDRVHWAWANFLYINNYIPIDKQFLGYSWYVAAEEQFYLLLPLVLLGLPRRWLVHGLIGLFLVAVVIRYVVLATAHPAIEFVVTPALDNAGFHRWYDGMHNKTHMRFGIPLCGVLGAYVFRRTRFVPYLSERPGISLAVFAAALAPILWIFSQLDYVEYHAWSTPWFLTLENYGGAICVTVLVLLLLTTQGIGAWFAKLLSPRWFFPIAQLSYAIYLIHPLVLFAGLGARYPKPPETYDALDLVRLWPGNLALSIGIALVFHLAVEKPVVRMRQH